MNILGTQGIEDTEAGPAAMMLGRRQRLRLVSRLVRDEGRALLLSSEEKKGEIVKAHEKERRRRRKLLAVAAKLARREDTSVNGLLLWKWSAGTGELYSLHQLRAAGVQLASASISSCVQKTSALAPLPPLQHDNGACAPRKRKAIELP